MNDCAPSNFNPNTKCFVHLHTEVRTTGPSSGLRIQLFCGVSGNVIRQGNNYTADDCNSFSCPSTHIIFSSTIVGNTIEVIQADDSIRAEDVLITGTASVAYFAGDRITLKPGFRARKYTYFHAMINECNGSITG